MKKITTLILFLLAVLTAHAGRVITHTLHSDVMNRDIPVTVITPDDLTGPLPVVYLLHGAFGNERS